MRWTVLLLLVDTALPALEHDDLMAGSTIDCSNVDFECLVLRASDAAIAILQDSVDEEDITIRQVAAERFPDRSWSGRRVVCKADWRQLLDTNLPLIAGASASSIWLQLTENPDACDTLERTWTDAARAALVQLGDIDSAVRLLSAIQSLRRQLLPGTRCFTEFNNQPGVLDCRFNAASDGHPDNKKRPWGSLVVVEVEIREGG